MRLDLEELPAVFDVEEALKPGAPIVTHWGNNTFMYEGHPCRRVRFGDVEAAFARADHIVEGVYDTSPSSTLRPRRPAASRCPEANGRYTVYTNTQALYFSLDNTQIILQVPGNRLHFVGGTVGGGFGGKVDVIVEPIATLGGDEDEPSGPLSSTAAPRRCRCRRPAAPGASTLKDGVTADGRIIARKVTSYADSRRLQPPDAVRAHQARRQRGRAVRASRTSRSTPTASTRTASRRARCAASAMTMASFALEVQMDKIAELVGLDPWTIRFINAYRNGDIKPHRKLVEDATLIETMQAAAELVGHELPRRAARR